MTSSTEAELAELYLKAKTLVPIHNTLKEMGLPQSKSSIQTDNSTSSGFTNNTIMNKAIKSLDKKFSWLRDRESQDQLKYYWARGQANKGNYSTEHHLPTHHETKRRKKNKRYMVCVYSSFFCIFLFLYESYTKHYCKGVWFHVECDTGN